MQHYYKAREKKILPCILLILPLFRFVFLEIKMLDLIFVLFAILLLALNYDMTISERYLTYRIRLFSWSVYRRTILPESMSQVIYKRVGLSTPCMIIKAKRGMGLRLIHFKPRDMDERMRQFCHTHGINMKVEKEYDLFIKKSEI